MKDYNIYLSGGMQKFGKEEFEKGNKWRIDFRWFFENCGFRYQVKVWNPNEYFNFVDEPRYESELEVMRFDLYMLSRSDLVVVNFNDEKSLGTMAEMAIAYNKNIPIIGLNTERRNLHPWSQCMCERVFDDSDELLEYVRDFYLK